MLAAAAVVVSCKKPGPEDDITPGSGTETKSGIKVTLPSSGPLSVYRWSSSDRIRVGDGVFSLKEGVGSATGVFDGTPAKDNYYTIAYPSDITGTDSYLAYSLSGQTQSGNGSVDHLVCTALIEDANTWEDVTLSEAWATSKGGSFRTNGVIAFNLTLPSDAGAVSGITLESSGVQFPVNNSGTSTAESLELAFSGVSASSAIKAYLAVAEKVVEIPAGALKLTVTGDNTYTIMVPQAVKMGAGILTDITVSDASAWSAYSPLSGNGTNASPYILKTPEDIEQMPELLVDGQTTWFELGADIDMASVIGWDPLNILAPYGKAVNFDGKGHTISNFTCESGIYPSFFGVLNGTVKDVTFENAQIKGSGKTGVIAGYCGTNIGSNDAPQYIKGDISGVTVKNSSVEADSYAGGIFGQVYCPSLISDCHVINTSISSSGERVGGLIGQMGVSNFSVGAVVKECTAENVTAEAQKNVGGLIGVSYGETFDCTASGQLTTILENSKEVSVGGLIGHLENGLAADCSASTVIVVTLQGRGLGGFVGTFKSGRIERCYSTGNVSGIHRNTGGFVGLIQTSLAAATIENCYCSGDVSANSYEGGFVGLVDGQPYDAIIKNCYSCGDVIASNFGTGGFVGFQSCTKFQALNCAAWSDTVKAGTIGEANWSSGAFVGVTYPLSTITNCYRNPDMELFAFWVPDANYSHPDVSPTSPLIKQNGQPTTATSTGNGQDGYPHFPYHGKVAPGKSLSELASTTLGWDATVWDFSGDLPKLKK